MKVRDNNFDLLRLIAPFFVIFAHAYALNGVDSPLTIYTKQISEGNIAVYLFFAISGFLIPQSYLKRGNAWEYLKARILRIIPGIFVVTLLSVFILGPLVTELSWRDYFSSDVTWRYLKNSYPINIKYQLPGVFQHNILGVNGSLWSIKLEIRAYIAVMILGLLHLLKYRFVILGLFLIYFLTYAGMLPIEIKDNVYYLMFLSGAVFYFFRDFIPYESWIAVCSIAILSYASTHMALLKVFPICGVYLIMYLAHSQKLRAYDATKYGDFSYGLYLYAFPIQQLLIHVAGGKMDPVLNFVLTIPFCLACAVLSWHFVEKPSLGYKKKFIGYRK